MSTNPIEQKLRNLQLNLRQSRTDDRVPESGIYFSRPPPATAPANVFSSYIDTVHKALDSSKDPSLKDDCSPYYSHRYHDEYIPYDYHPRSDCYYLSNEMCQPLICHSNDENDQQWRDEMSISPSNDTEMKTDLVHFRKKQFETGQVENLLQPSQRQSKKKIYSEKSKYENEWNRLTASTAVESVMERAAHFEQIDPDKFPKFKSKTNSSSQENLTDDEDYSHQHFFKPIQMQKSLFFFLFLSNLSFPLI